MGKFIPPATIHLVKRDVRSICGPQSRCGLFGVEKIPCLYRDKNPVPSHLQSSLCTDYANLAPYYEEMLLKLCVSLVKVKTKFTLEEAMKVQKGNRRIILSFL